ncbi:MAG TPA: hypothetical protein ENN13_04880 [Candidatus Altiarchaeales archaeon]|nr:hypothetical protein [Candidatus Altiarchaeales archaeon]
MKKNIGILCAIALLVILSQDSLAWHAILPIQIERVHVGTQVRDDFEIPEYVINPVFKFKILTALSNATLTFDAYEVDVDNDEIIVNGIFAANVCKSERKFRKSWIECEIILDPALFNTGTNTISFQSGLSQSVLGPPRDYDDYMIKNVMLKADYKHLEPYFLENKAVVPNNTIVGTPVEVKISLTNIGVKPAINTTIIDYAPLGTRIIGGSREKFIPTINLQETVTHSYLITAVNPGAYYAPRSLAIYMNEEGELFRKNITATKLEFRLPKPVLNVSLSTRKEVVTVGETVEFNLEITNYGPGEARNITFSSTPPLKSELVAGPESMISLGENQTLHSKITVRFTDTSQQIYRVYTHYEDSALRGYVEKSSDVEVSIVEKTDVEIFKAKTLLAIIIVAILVIAILIVILRQVGL